MWTHLEEKLENQDCFLKKSLELIGYFFPNEIIRIYISQKQR
jgi:hypothetical protein